MVRSWWWVIVVAGCLLCCVAEAKTKRNPKARAWFVWEHPCPATGQRDGPCHGFVVDHIKPLACGGEDDPRNMQWQTADEAREKDRWERRECQPSH